MSGTVVHGLMLELGRALIVNKAMELFSQLLSQRWATTETTIEAIMCSFRARGVAVLWEEANRTPIGLRLRRQYRDQ